MRRWLLIVFAVLLPFQFAWSGASAYCQHETADGQALHIGHHFHAHDGDAAPAAAGTLSAHADCAACHTAGSSVIASRLTMRALGALFDRALPMSMPRFTSVPARAPDRPQWLRLV